jgi:glycosyltransferase involved in cell wall biosynthesis
LDIFDPGNIDANAKQQLQTELKIHKDDIIVSYLGSIGGWYLTDEMMRFCKMLSDRMPQVKFLFISPHLHHVITNAAAKYNLAADKLIVKHGKRHEVPLLLSFSTYSIFFIKPCYSKISSSPTKHGEIMAMGIPVITNSGVGDVKEVVVQYNSGYVVDNFSDESFNHVIENIIQQPYFDRTGIRKGAIEFYSLDLAAERYDKVYKKILSSLSKS